MRTAARSALLASSLLLLACGGAGAPPGPPPGEEPASVVPIVDLRADVNRSGAVELVVDPHARALWLRRHAQRGSELRQHDDDLLALAVRWRDLHGTRLVAGEADLDGLRRARSQLLGPVIE